VILSLTSFCNRDTSVIPRYDEYGHIVTIRVGLKNELPQNAEAEISITVSNQAVGDSNKREGKNSKNVVVPPYTTKEDDIPLDSSILVKSGTTSICLLVT